MKKSELRQMIREEIQKLNEASYVALKSLGKDMAIDSYEATIFNSKSSKSKGFEYGTPKWFAAYKKMSKEDKKMVDGIADDWMGRKAH